VTAGTGSALGAGVGVSEITFGAFGFLGAHGSIQSSSSTFLGATTGLVMVYWKRIGLVGTLSGISSAEKTGVTSGVVTTTGA